jgi:hypothetical protein
MLYISKKFYFDNTNQQNTDAQLKDKFR